MTSNVPPASRLFEALKLGKRIPDSEVFLFKGTSTFCPF
jgi:hypothetical protein